MVVLMLLLVQVEYLKSLDGSFGTGGKVITDFNSGNDRASDIKLLSDGRILVGGWARNSGTDVFALAMYTSTGTLTSFGAGGKVLGSFTGYGRSLALNKDESLIYFTGLSNSAGTLEFWRLHCFKFIVAHTYFYECRKLYCNINCSIR
jgi:hypothetical protein